MTAREVLLPAIDFGNDGGMYHTDPMVLCGLLCLLTAEKMIEAPSFGALGAYCAAAGMNR